jgi:alpha/beta superfamily hydrolase
MNSIIIRIDRLYACSGIGNVNRYLNEQTTNGIGCHHDEHLLVMPGAADPMSCHLQLEHWKQQGLRLTRKVQGTHCWEDFCIIDSVNGPTLPCPWLDWDPENGTVSLKESERTAGTVIIAHGKESGPHGDKIKALSQVARKHRLLVIAPDFRGIDDPEERVEHLIGLARGVNGPLYLAGSSMGGYVVIRASQMVETAGLFLMAPAIGIPDYADQLLEPGCSTIRVVHAWQDEVIPVQQVITWAQQHKAELHLVNSDHRLSGEIGQLRFLFSSMLKPSTR